VKAVTVSENLIFDKMSITNSTIIVRENDLLLNAEFTDITDTFESPKVGVTVYLIEDTNSNRTYNPKTISIALTLGYNMVQTNSIIIGLKGFRFEAGSGYKTINHVSLQKSDDNSDALISGYYLTSPDDEHMVDYETYYVTIHNIGLTDITFINFNIISNNIASSIPTQIVLPDALYTPLPSYLSWYPGDNILLNYRAEGDNDFYTFSGLPIGWVNNGNFIKGIAEDVWNYRIDYEVGLTKYNPFGIVTTKQKIYMSILPVPFGG
tara:strand:- start:861 stop:1655 length:795 start_codon:yes stop_codon:yes gene_type:complete